MGNNAAFYDAHNPRLADLIGVREATLIPFVPETAEGRHEALIAEPFKPLSGDLDDGLVDEAGHYVAPDVEDYAEWPPLDFEGYDDEYLAEEAFEARFER